METEVRWSAHAVAVELMLRVPSLSQALHVLVSVE